MWMREEDMNTQHSLITWLSPLLLRVELMAFWAVSTFWIANPNNNLIENAAAGAQDVGIWCLFHRVPTKQSERKHPEGQAERTPGSVLQQSPLQLQGWSVYWKRSKDKEKLKIPGSISLSIMPGFQTMELDSLWQVMGLSQQTAAPAWRLHVPFLLEKAATLAPREAKTATGEKGQMENTEHSPETRHFLSMDSRFMMGLSGWEDALSRSSP